MSKLDNKKKYRINIIISLAISLGFILTIIINSMTYNSIIKEDIKNISKLSSSNIYSEINNELIKPIFVSLTMANDSFLKQWLRRESQENINQNELVQYLEGLRGKYAYNSVFMISANTNDYYHYKGLHKTISSLDSHDQWYFDFINSGKLYDLDVDKDEADGNALTVFVNCRIENEEGELMGVVGVGLDMNEVQHILANFEEEYDLEAFLIDQDGLAQVHTSKRLIENYNIHEDETIRNFVEDIFSNKTSLETYRYKENGIDGYLITRFIEDLEWTLIVKKDTSVLRKTLYSQMGEVIAVIFLVIIVVMLISNNVISGFQRKMNDMAKTDELTGALNRRGFNQILYESLKKGEEKEHGFTAFIFDIDDFKKLNDKYGHLFGDKIIALLSSKAKKCLGEKGVVARWGGDEFAGIIYEELETSHTMLLDLQKQIAMDKQFGEYQLTISIGVTSSRGTDTPDIIIGRVDNGLYKSKEAGKDCISIL